MKIQEGLTELVFAAQNGDAEATRQLLESCSQSIYYIAYKMFKNKETAEDMTQEALTAIWKRLDTLKEPEAFYGWADRIAANLCIDALRKKGVKIDPGAGEPEVYEAIPEPNESFLPESALDKGETQRLVGSIIDNLPEAQRMCVLLYYFREMSVADIAASLGCSDGTVKSRLSAARDKIRAGVMRLERENGVKLYALPLFPLLLGESTAVWTPELTQKLMPAGISAVGTAAAAAADGAAKTGLSGFIEAVKAKFAALSLGGKVTAGVTAAAVTTATAAVVLSGSADITPTLKGDYYRQQLSPIEAHYVLCLKGPEGLVNIEDVEGLSYEVVETSPGVKVGLPCNSGHNADSEENKKVWFEIITPSAPGTHSASVQMEVDGNRFELNLYELCGVDFPGVVYAQDPVVVTPGEPVRFEDVIAQLPAGMELMSMSIRIVSDGNVQNVWADEEGTLVLGTLPAGSECILQWGAHDPKRDITYLGEKQIIVKDAADAATPDEE